MNFKRVVIKVGSAVLSENGKLAKERIRNLVELIAKLKKAGIEIILVSSGAVSAGYKKLKLDKKVLANRQALASIGQSYLMSIYQKKFNDCNITISQILLTQADFDSRKRSQNIQNTINILLENGVVPIINENDSVATDELVFGDNDQLSAYSTYYLNADILIILSDIDGYYTDNPTTNKNATIRKIVNNISESELNQIVTPNNEFATGGIVTKLKSAKFLMDKKKSMFLSSGYNLTNVEKYLLENAYKKGTLFRK